MVKFRKILEEKIKIHKCLSFKISLVTSFLFFKEYKITIERLSCTYLGTLSFPIAGSNPGLNCWPTFEVSNLLKKKTKYP